MRPSVNIIVGLCVATTIIVILLLMRHGSSSDTDPFVGTWVFQSDSLVCMPGNTLTIIPNGIGVYRLIYNGPHNPDLNRIKPYTLNTRPMPLNANGDDPTVNHFLFYFDDTEKVGKKLSDGSLSDPGVNFFPAKMTLNKGSLIHTILGGSNPTTILIKGEKMDRTVKLDQLEVTYKVPSPIQPFTNSTIKFNSNISLVVGDSVAMPLVVNKSGVIYCNGLNAESYPQTYWNWGGKFMVTDLADGTYQLFDFNTK